MKTLGGDDTVTVDPGVSALIIPVVDLGADHRLASADDWARF